MFERSSTSTSDTDGDTLSDRDEYYTYKTFPVTKDTDGDALADDFELRPKPLTIAVDGTTSTLSGIVTDPTRPDTDGDNLTDGQEFGFVSAVGTKVIGEVGYVHENVDSTWRSVRLRNRYTAPVAIAEPLTWFEHDLAHVRIRNVSPTGFERKVEEWTAGAHIRESAAYLVMESGVFSLGEGSVLEAGRVDAASTAVSVAFRQSFPSAPSVLTQTQTTNGAGAAVSRTYAVSSTGFLTRLQSSSTETVGFVAVGTGRGSAGAVSFLAGRTSYIWSDGWAGINFPKFTERPPLVFAWMDSYLSGATPGLRHGPVTNQSFRVWLEDSHIASANSEAIAHLALTGPRG